MKKETIHHELLVFTSSGVAARQLTDKKEAGSYNGLATTAAFEKACWNGILFDLFPEILGPGYPKCESFLWQVYNRESCIYVNIGPTPLVVESGSSIDPYIFLMNVCEN